MDQPAEQVAAADSIEVDHVGHGWPVALRQDANRRPLVQRSVRPMLVVVPDIRREAMVEVAAAEDQQPVEALATDAADPALRVRSRLRRPHRRLDHPDPLEAEDLVELTGELAVAITDQEPPRADLLVVELHQQVPRLLGHPRPVWIGGDPGETDTAGRKLDEEQHVEAPHEEPVDGERVTLKDARRLLAQKLSPTYFEAFRCRLDPRLPRIAQTVLAASLTPRPTSSPWIRRYPQPGFSRASRTTSSRTSAGMTGRPGRRCGYVQRRATSSRCQRRSVAGVTHADVRHTCRGRTRLNAASSARSASVSCGRAT